MPTTLLHGDCLDILPTIPDDSVDAIVTDPPYELGFMGKKWDASGIAYDVGMWAECLRVLKPGGHLLAFGGTRTYHRMVVAIEDAGFEIRDSIHWLYGSGFPKSLDVGKAIDKVNGEPDRLLKFTAWMRTTGLTARQIDEITDTNMGGHYLTAKSQPAIPTAAMWQRLRSHCGDVPEWVDQLVARIEAEREVVGSRRDVATRIYDGGEGKRLPPEIPITAPATDAAKQWQGWGTALKPAHEPIVVARKPLDGTVAANVLEHGTGALNIDGCRVGYASEADKTAMAVGVESIRERGGVVEGSWKNSSDLSGANPAHTAGRWPANVIHDGSDDILQRFPNSKGGAYPAQRSPAVNTAFGEGQPTPGGPRQMGDDGSAARFFAATPYTDLDGDSFLYCSKPNRKERNAGGDNRHPTVKPLALMRYLIRLITPPNGTVLDPFAGSGTTLAAATLEGVHSIGIELTDDYLPTIEGRVAWAEAQAGDD